MLFILVASEDPPSSRADTWAHPYTTVWHQELRSRAAEVESRESRESPWTADHNTGPLSQIICSHVNQSYSDHGILCIL